MLSHLKRLREHEDLILQDHPNVMCELEWGYWYGYPGRIYSHGIPRERERVISIYSHGSGGGSFFGFIPTHEGGVIDFQIFSHATGEGHTVFSHGRGNQDTK